jgi:hypothetical protein
VQQDATVQYSVRVIFSGVSYCNENIRKVRVIKFISPFTYKSPKSVAGMFGKDSRNANFGVKVAHKPKCSMSDKRIQRPPIILVPVTR